MEGKKYFFEGKSEIDQLCKVFEVRGAANVRNQTNHSCSHSIHFLNDLFRKQTGLDALSSLSLWILVI